MNQSVNPFLEAALEMQKQWNETVSSLQNVASSKATGLGGLDPASFARAWADGVRAVVDQSMAASSQSGRVAVPDLMEQAQQAASAYTAMLKLWSQTPFGPGEGQTGDLFGSAANWMGSVMQSFMDAANPQAVPPGVASAEGWQSAAATMFSNWTRFMADMSRRAKSGIDLDESHPEMMRHFYESWRKGYETTLGSFINFTAVGPARYDLEKLSKNTDTYLKYQAASFDFTSKLVSTGLEALQDVMEQSQELFSEEVTDETFDQFYHLLMRVGERRYHELFTAPLFCHSLETLVSTGLDYHRASSEMTEEALRMTPIVTQSQADEIHREIYLLKKRLAELERRAVERDKGE